MTRRVCGTAVALLLLSLVTPVCGEQYFIYSPKPLGPDETTAPAKDGVLVREVPVQKGDTLSGISRKYSGHGSYYSQILLFNEIKNPNLIYTGDTLKVPVTREQAPEEATNVKGKPVLKPAKAARKHHAKSTARSRKHPVAAATAPSPSVELSLKELKGIEGDKEKKRAAMKKTEGGPKHAKHERTTQKPAPAAVGRKPGQADAAGSAVTAKQERRPVGVDAKSGQKLYEQALKAYRQEDCRTALEMFDRYLAENPSSPLAADASLYKAECYLKLSAQ